MRCEYRNFFASVAKYAAFFLIEQIMLRSRLCLFGKGCVEKLTTIHMSIEYSVYVSVCNGKRNELNHKDKPFEEWQQAKI